MATGPSPYSGGQMTHDSRIWTHTEERDIITIIDGTSNDGITPQAGQTPVGKTNPEIMVSYLQSPPTATGRIQEVLYQKGVGTHDTHSIPRNVAQLVAGMALGEGVGENVILALTAQARLLSVTTTARFIDVGFSRGGFTAKWAADIKSRIGLPWLPESATQEEWYEVTFRIMDFYIQQIPRLEANDSQTPFSSDELLQVINGMGGTIVGPASLRVTCVAVYDPVMSWHEAQANPGVNIQSAASEALHNALAQPHMIIQSYFSAIALNEHRSQFPAMIATGPPAPTQRLIQVGFLGGHSDVGADTNSIGTGKISRMWMTAMMQQYCNIQVDPDNFATFLRQDPNATGLNVQPGTGGGWMLGNMTGGSTRFSIPGRWTNFSFHNTVFEAGAFFPSVTELNPVYAEWRMEGVRNGTLPTNADEVQTGKPEMQVVGVWQVASNPYERNYQLQYQRMLRTGNQGAGPTTGAGGTTIGDHNAPGAGGQTYMPQAPPVPSSSGRRPWSGMGFGKKPPRR